MKKKITYHGYGEVVDMWHEGIHLRHPDTYKMDVLITKIDELISKNSNLFDDKAIAVDEYYGGGEHDATNYVIPNVSIKIYSSDRPSTLEEAEDKLVQSIYGDFDARTENYGYSEYTVMGFDLVRMELGGHDLTQIFESLEGKYVHFLFEVEVDVPEDYEVYCLDMPNSEVDEPLPKIDSTSGSSIPLTAYVANTVNYFPLLQYLIKIMTKMSNNNNIRYKDIHSVENIHLFFTECIS